jgi:hypothetical protein
MASPGPEVNGKGSKFKSYLRPPPFPRPEYFILAFLSGGLYFGSFVFRSLPKGGHVDRGAAIWAIIIYCTANLAIAGILHDLFWTRKTLARLLLGACLPALSLMAVLLGNYLPYGVTGPYLAAEATLLLLFLFPWLPFLGAAVGWGLGRLAGYKVRPVPEESEPELA